MSQDFWPFFSLKDSTWAPYEQAKTVLRTFLFLQRYSQKNVYPRSQRIRWHTWNYFTLEKIKNKKVMKKKIEFFLKIGCLQSRWLWRHRVLVVVDYADTSMTTRTLFENFEGFSQILKKQSGKKSYLGVFTHPIAIIWTFENRCIERKIWVSA